MVTLQAVWYVLHVAGVHRSLLTYNRSNIGSIICSVMMQVSLHQPLAAFSSAHGLTTFQQLNHKYPDNYLLAMRILWAPVGLMIVFWMFVPESPWFYARHGNKEKALKAMRQLYGGVPAYDYEEEYGIIERTIAHERAVLKEVPSVIHIFKGLNLVRAHRWFRDRSCSNRGTEANSDCHGTGSSPAARRIGDYQYILYLYVPFSLCPGRLADLLVQISSLLPACTILSWAL
jgi:hypothetical protein